MRICKQVNIEKLHRIMDNEEYEIVLLRSGSGYISETLGEKRLSLGKPLLSASFAVPYSNMVVAVLHNDFLYTIRREDTTEGSNPITYIDREHSGWWWERGRIVSLPELFWTHPKLKIFEFNKKEEKKDGSTIS